MDPATMAMMATMAMNAIAAMNPGGSDAETKSTYNPSQLGGIEDIWKMIEGMRGGANQGDISGNQNFSQGSDWLNSLFNDPEFFNNFEAPMMRDYQENTIPDLANRFASMGSGGALGSSGFRNQATREAGNLHSNLAAMRGGMQQQGVGQSLQYAQQPFQNLMQMMGLGLGHPTENVYQPASNPFAPIAGAATQGFMQSRSFPGQSTSTM